MKIVISENKREFVALTWLNQNYGDLQQVVNERNGNIFLKTGDGETVFAVVTKFDDNVENPARLIEKSMLCIQYSVLDFVSSFFGYDDNDGFQLIADWFVSKYGFDIEYLETTDSGGFEYYGDNNDDD